MYRERTQEPLCFFECAGSSVLQESRLVRVEFGNGDGDLIVGRLVTGWGGGCRWSVAASWA